MENNNNNHLVIGEYTSQQTLGALQLELTTNNIPITVDIQILVGTMVDCIEMIKILSRDISTYGAVYESMNAKGFTVITVNPAVAQKKSYQTLLLRTRSDYLKVLKNDNSKELVLSDYDDVIEGLIG